MKTSMIPARRVIQVLFLILVFFIGIKFYLFVSHLEKGMIPDFERPAGVEAFLPISALVSLKHWLYTGSINNIHPSGLILFLIICATALFTKKGFCSWICPLGFLSEYLAKLHMVLFKKKLNIPSFIDFSLRSLKYLIAGFFIYQIFYKMPINSIEQFIQSPYNRFADIKMLKFFTQISTTALLVLIGLLVLSIFIQNFWCRYLCPYGALLGLIGLFSMGKIHRRPSSCTECGKCEKSCPGMIPIRRKIFVHSTECSACLACIQSCPEKDAIQFSFFNDKKSFTSGFIALTLLFLFFGGIALAKLTGNWQNKITTREYLSYVSPEIRRINSTDKIDPKKIKKMILMMKQFKGQQIRMQDLQKNKGD